MCYFVNDITMKDFPADVLINNNTFKTIDSRRAQTGRNLTKHLPFVTSVTLSNTYITHVNSVSFVTS
jgi:hypothetical protein